MDWRSNLKRAQSLSLSSTGDQAAWTEPKLEERAISVSRLVARYQNAEGEPAPVLKPLNKENEPKSRRVSQSRPEIKQPQKEAVARRDNKGQATNSSNLVRSKSTSSLQTRSKPTSSLQTSGKTASNQQPSRKSTSSLQTSSKSASNQQPSRKSTSSLQTSSKSASNQQTSPVTIKSLRSLFEPQEVSQNEPKDSSRSAVRSSSYKETSTKKVMNGDVQKTQRPAEKPKATGPAARPASRLKDDRSSEKVVAKTRAERRKTIGGIDFELLAASQADENRRLLEEFRSSLLLQDKENLTVSVKAISALYMSKVAPQEAEDTNTKPVREPSPERRRSVKAAKFQPVPQETCSACLTPVFLMEKITTDQHVFHKTCFCCKKCKKKLSMSNYVPMYGELYCTFHYQQLFRRKGNYDEGFGHVQHKDLWLQKNYPDTDSQKKKVEKPAGK